MGSEVGEVILNVAACSVKILDTVKIKLRTLNLDSAYIIFAFQGVLPEKENFGRNVFYFIIYPVQVKDQQLISVKMQRNVLLFPKKQVNSNIAQKQNAGYKKGRADHMEPEPHNATAKQTEEEKNDSGTGSIPPLVGAGGELLLCFHG